MYIELYDEDDEFDGYGNIKDVFRFFPEFFGGHQHENGEPYVQLVAEDKDGEILFRISEKFYLEGLFANDAMEKAAKLLQKIIKKINENK